MHLPAADSDDGMVASLVQVMRGKEALWWQSRRGGRRQGGGTSSWEWQNVYGHMNIHPGIPLRWVKYKVLL